jgi:hypothetical protein
MAKEFRIDEVNLETRKGNIILYDKRQKLADGMGY